MAQLDDLPEPHISETQPLRKQANALQEEVSRLKLLEEALREKEALYRNLVEAIPYGILEFDLNGTVTYANQAMYHIYGLEEGELVGQPIWKIAVNSQQSQGVQELFQLLISQQPTPTPYEDYGQRKDGQIIRVHVDWEYKRDVDRNLLGIIAVVTDVTESRAIQQALVASEKEKSLILDTTQEMFAFYDLNLRVLWANKSAGDSVRLPVEALIGRHCYEIWHGRSELCENCPVQKAKETGEPQQAELTTPDGRVWYIRGYPMFDEKGQLSGLIEFTQNITERRRSEQALEINQRQLAESNRMLQTVLDSIPIRLFWKDRDSRYLGCNTRFASDAGYSSPSDVVGKTDVEMIWGSRADLYQRADQKVIRSGNPMYNFEEPQILPDGEVIWTRTSKVPLKDLEDEIIGVLGVYEDITVAKLAENSLRDSEERLRQALDAGAIGLFDWNIVENQAICTKRYFELFCIEPSQETTSLEQWLACVHPEDRQRASQEVRALLEDQVPYNTEYRVTWPDGSVHWLASQGKAFFDAEGKAVRMIGAMRDITERKLYEEALRISEERQALILNSLPVAVYTDGIGDPLAETWYSDSVYKLTGYPASDFREDEAFWRDHVHPDDIERVMLDFATNLSTGVVNTEYRFRIADGSYRWIQDCAVSSQVQEGAGGTTGEVAGVMFDITERKLAEFAIQKQAQELESLNQLSRKISTSLSLSEVSAAALDALSHLVKPDLITLFLVEGERMFLQAMSGVEEVKAAITIPEHRVGECMCGLAVRDGKALYSIDIHADDRCTWDECKRAGLRSFASLPLQSGNTMIGVIGLASRERRDFENQAAFLETIAGEVAIGIQNARLYNQLERQAAELEQRVRQRTAQLQAANRELEAFSYSVSHDLRAPLRAVDGFSRLLLEEYQPALDQQGLHYITHIREAAGKMDRLTEDLLRLSRVTRSELNPMSVNLTDLVENILHELRRDQPERKVEWVVARDVIVQADTNLMRIMLDNLLRNAWKFTQRRELARLEFGVTWQDHVPVYYIRDNGAGFDMAQAGRLFKPFNRLHDAVDFEGTGIGLAIVQRIINRHEGRVWVESAVNQGTAVYFTLPGTAVSG